jgi:AraC-like DNA-binding protein
MKRNHTVPFAIDSIAALFKQLGLPKPMHPLVSVVRFEDIRRLPAELPATVTLNFYSIWLKKDFNGRMKYGHKPYDFDEGLMSFFLPGQVLTSEAPEELQHTGYWLILHPDILWKHPLAGKIREYGFFSYAVNEALHLSEKEESMISGILQNIEEEYRQPIDEFSAPSILSQVETLLIYAERFYRRQFVTRKKANHTVLARFETLVRKYIDSDRLLETGIPTVQELARALQISPNYLSDLLRSLTGKNTQQHIQERLIEKAKEQLSTTSLSVSEIAYGLGFGYPQSFSKLFKSKTKLSPQAFRAGFN